MNLIIHKQSIYKVNTSSGSGTGFFIKDKNYLITNYHVVEGYREVSVEDYKQDRFLGKVVYINPQVDIAFVVIDKLGSDSFSAKENSLITINSNLDIKEQDKLFVLGYPFGMPFTITEGIVSSPEQPMGKGKYVQTDAAVNPGNSGGPMLNGKGNLIAITTSKFKDADNVGFGIPLKFVEKEIEVYENSQLNDILSKKSNKNATQHYDQNLEKRSEQNVENNLDKLENFSLACPTCHHLIHETAEYCDSCGAKLDKTWFDTVKLDDISVFVESSLKELKMNPVLARTGRRYWDFYQDRAMVRIFIYSNDYLFATSPTNGLPTNNLKELYQYLLTDPVNPYKLGISDNEIFISYRVHLNDIFSDKQEQIKDELYKFALKANDIGSYLFENFACELSDSSKKQIDSNKPIGKKNLAESSENSKNSLGVFDSCTKIFSNIFRNRN